MIVSNVSDVRQHKKQQDSAYCLPLAVAVCKQRHKQEVLFTSDVLDARQLNTA